MGTGTGGPKQQASGAKEQASGAKEQASGAKEQASGVKEQAGGAVFYRFQDATGRVHIVDSLDLVPQALRGRAERIQYAEPSSVSVLPAVPAALAPVVQRLGSWPALALAGGALLLIFVLFRQRRGVLRVVLRFGMMLALAALVASAYFGWLRRTTQQSGSSAPLASPFALIDDAKSAVEKMNARTRAQQAELKEAEQAR